MSFIAYFAENGSPKTGLSPTIIVRKDSDGTVVVNGVGMTETGNGFYQYTYAAQDFSEGYHFIADSVTLTGSERYAVGHESAQALAVAIKAKTDNLPPGVAKGVALSNFEFLMIQDDHVSVKIGATVSGFISQDGGPFAALTNAVSEVGRGVYKVNLTAAEMNADVITLVFTAGGADQRTVTIKTSA
ncbi:MAG: hypothetical protein V1689_05235 [Pseudomonadota bacterium]